MFFSVCHSNQQEEADKAREMGGKVGENPFAVPNKKKTAASQCVEKQQPAWQDEANLQGVPRTTFKSCQGKSRR